MKQNDIPCLKSWPNQIKGSTSVLEYVINIPKLKCDFIKTKDTIIPYSIPERLLYQIKLNANYTYSMLKKLTLPNEREQ